MYKVFVVLVAVTLMTAQGAFAMCGSCDMGAKADAAEKAGTTIENAGNKFCPVTGEAVDGMTTYEYQGKAYNFCCPMCVDTFKKNPRQYIEKIEAQSKSASSGSEHEGHQHSH